MNTNILVIRTTELAWDYWLNAAPNQRKQTPKVQFDGRRFVPIPVRPSAKGVSTLIHNFMFTSDSFIDKQYYTNDRQIRPDSFVDRRDWQFDEIFKPGIPLTPEQLLEARKPYRYTIWSNGDELRQHAINPPQLQPLLDAISSIVRYWHISLSRYPLSQPEEASAFFNAVGLGYLYHPKLPVNHGRAAGLLPLS